MPGNRPHVPRPRLLATLAGRFDRRLTTVVAGPGFGKTALLTSALAENELQPRGVDVWLQCRPDDADAAELASGLLTGLGRQAEPTVDAVIDALWSRAPEDVALVLDDVHAIPPGSPGEQAMADLLAALPRNGHLLIAGRQLPPLPVARLRLRDEVVELGEAELAFDDDELSRFAVERGVAPDLLATVRWPALAELVAVAGREAATEYLWEEVLDQIDPDRLEAISRLALFDAVDDDLLRAVTDSDLSAEDLFGDLPLTDGRPDGSLRLHALWLPALRLRRDAGMERDVLRRGAAHLLERGDLRQAFTASAAAEDLDGQRSAIRSAVVKPLARTPLGDLRFLADRLPPGPDLEVEAALLRAILSLSGSEATAIGSFENAAELARFRGDGEAECVALWRLYQSELWAGSRDRIPAIMARLSELAGSGEPLAELLVEIESAVELGRQGRRDEALRTIHACDRPGRETVLAQTVDLRGGVLLDLGCPEEIGLPTAVDELASGLAGEDARVVAFATWLRGDVSPELAITIGQEMASGIRPVRLTHQQVALSGVVALIAVHAGDLEQAEALVERGGKLVGHIGGGHGANFLRVAEASLAVARHDEQRAVGLLEEALAEVPMEVLPARSYLNSLPLLHLLVPEVRPMIDRANLGPALTTVQEMARALTAQREEGDLTAAVALPWRRPALLRVHVAPPHLAELAVAAVIGGVPEAEAVLGELPDLRGLLRWVATVHHGPVAEWAHQRLVTLPTRPSHSLRIEVLGGLRLFRDGVQVVDKEWRRERVRQMLCFLLGHPQTTPGEVVTALWPELDERSASANLRTNLGHLQRVLEPDRAQREAPWFVRRDGESLVLTSEGLESDVARFDALTEEGRNLEERGVPGGALSCYLSAIELYRGDYMAGLDDRWIIYERIRIRSLFVTTAARAGELLLARGEPEQALRRADEVTAIDELAEQGHRLRVRALLALGDRSAARTSAERLLRVLAEAGLEPEHDTRRLLTPLGLTDTG